MQSAQKEESASFANPPEWEYDHIFVVGKKKNIGYLHRHRSRRTLTELKSGVLGVPSRGGLSSLIHRWLAISRKTGSSARSHLLAVLDLLPSILLPAPEAHLKIPIKMGTVSQVQILCFSTTLRSMRVVRGRKSTYGLTSGKSRGIHP